jgi:hypothetical protein
VSTDVAPVKSHKGEIEESKNAPNKQAKFALPRTLFCPLLLAAEIEGESGQEILKTKESSTSTCGEMGPSAFIDLKGLHPLSFPNCVWRGN